MWSAKTFNKSQYLDPLSRYWEIRPFVSIISHVWWIFGFCKNFSIIYQKMSKNYFFSQKTHSSFKIKPLEKPYNLPYPTLIPFHIVQRTKRIPANNTQPTALFTRVQFFLKMFYMMIDVDGRQRLVGFCVFFHCTHVVRQTAVQVHLKSVFGNNK